MIKSVFGVLTACVAFAPAALAQMPVDQLIERTGIRASNQAVRDTPRWNGVDKIIVRAGVMDVNAARQVFANIEFVEVRSTREAIRAAQGADAFIGNCDAEFVAAARELVWLQRTGAGVESCVEIPAIADGRVVLTNMQKMDSPMIAEHAIAMMMSLARNLPNFARTMDDGRWVRTRAAREGMTSIVNKRLLVVGLGGIGTEVARMGSALGMQVSATRNSSRNGPDFVDYVGLSDELLSLAAEADVIVSALPLTDATTDLFDKAFFAVLKPSAMFINVGRGKSVVTDELVNALQTDKLAGAGLDVTEPEPLPADHILWSLPNVIITPHLSGSGGERERRAVLLHENLRRFVAGDALFNTVDPARGY